MEAYWFEVKYLLETLVMKAGKIDENGMDLSFTLGPEKLTGARKPAAFLKAMDKAAPKASKQRPPRQTDMRQCLRKILNSYIEKVRRINTKKLTLIILTDGIWAATPNRSDVDQTVIEFSERLRQLELDFEHRPVSIQFIQIGNDADATARLRRLDNDLKHENANIP